MNEIEYAIANLEDFLAADIGQGDLHMSSAEAALTALRSEAERSRGCDWCKAPLYNTSEESIAAWNRRANLGSCGAKMEDE